MMPELLDFSRRVGGEHDLRTEVLLCLQPQVTAFALRRRELAVYEQVLEALEGAGHYKLFYGTDYELKILHVGSQGPASDDAALAAFEEAAAIFSRERVWLEVQSEVLELAQCIIPEYGSRDVDQGESDAERAGDLA
jgi:hypothetical protein